MKYFLRACAAALCITLCFSLAGCGSSRPLLDPKSPVTITMWHYYNGAQKDALAKLVREFNATAGKEAGVVVEEFSQADVTTLEESVLAAAAHKPGADKMPNIFAAYADTAYLADTLGVVADVASYLSEEERAAYVEGYLDEGSFGADGSLKIFPIAKSTEIFMLNQTDWEPFSQASGLSAEQAFATIESLTACAKTYYEWSDAQTSEPNDGKALFGRDAFANYMIIGARQLGIELFCVQDGKPTLNFDKQVIRRLWDNYYVPTVSGWFTAENRFRSDDVKVGTILSFVGSSSGASFFPKEVVVSDTESHPVKMQVLPAPQFAGGKPFAVQQGAGMVVTTATDEEIYASVLFLKWLTQPERNLTFSMDSGYLPVTKAAVDLTFASAAMDAANLDAQMRSIIQTGLSTAANNTMYTTKAFAAGREVRNVLEKSMPEKAKADRAAVESALAGGADAQTVLAQYCSDENFEAWYAQTLTALQELLLPA
ncbi:MAG: extracellular solute-binding protein [Ruthenibacterium sp.]